MANKISDKYVKLTQREHVLMRPDTYIGSVNRDVKQLFVASNYDENINNTKMVYNNCEYSPGFIKIFDEIITNASDHAIRTGEVTYIKVKIDDNTISVENDGPGIPVIIHDKEKIHIPELIFGHLLAGENFKDTEDRFVGGRNGLGAKLTNIFSTYFEIDTADGKKKYNQIFTNNMSVVKVPKMRKSKASYTKITYKPDYEKFSMDGIDDVTMSILIKRVFDIAAYNAKIKVYFNDVLISLKTFKDYIKLFPNSEEEMFYEKINENWEIGLIKSPIDLFTNVSMVNGISTILGGTHVNYIINNMVPQIKTSLERGVKGVNIKVNDIKNRVLLFVNCKLPNPTFDTQTKENLTLRMIMALTKDVEISDLFLKKIAKAGLFADLVELSMMKEKLEAQKELNKQVGKRIRIDKLVDANNAGKIYKSQECHLYLTEGLSAKTTAITGFSIIGRNNNGCYPLKGKPLNVSGIPLKKVIENEEIKDLIQILGLEVGKKYKDTSELRYGKVVIFSDADSDGSHIKGLILNIFKVYWKELLELNYIEEFVSPTIIASKGKIKKMFYKLKDYDKWVSSITDITTYNVKYYKGLGTLGHVLSKEIFKDIDKHLIPLKYTNPERTIDLIDLAFNKKRADDRKEWLSNYKINTQFDKFAQETTIESFMDNEFIEFSMEDNVRSIPSVVDGLKPSQRKIIYTLLKLNKGEMNVGELFGHVKAHGQYHHGPASLEQGIIGMAQDYVGSNNLSLLEPLGSFGTRLSGGKDAAAARYIYTKLRDITKDIFMKEDNDILDYLEIDGKSVEPFYYAPIIPQVLLNGVEGIGTGWSSTVPKFKIDDLIEYTTNKINNKRSNIILTPYYEKFKGDVYYDEESDNCITKGILERVNNTTVLITELPINVWNDNYYTCLEDLLDKKLIKNYEKNCTDEQVSIRIKMPRELLATYTDNDLHNMFQLESKINMSNMHLFDSEGKIKKYSNQYEIIEDYYVIRIECYAKRRNFIIDKLLAKKSIVDNTIKFIKLVVKGEIKINNVSINVVIKTLENNNISMINDSYNYLLNLPIFKLTKEELIKLRDENNSLKNTLTEYQETTPEKMWCNDLTKLKLSLKKYRKDK